MLLLILAAASAMLVYGLISGMLGAVLPNFTRKFGLTPGQMGLMGLAQALGLIVASLAAGPMIGASSKRTALLVALSAAAAGLYMLPRARSVGQVVATLFLIDCGGGTIVEAANSLSFEMGSAMTEMAKANLLNAAFCVGGVLTPFLAANLRRRDSTSVLRVLLWTALVALALNAANPIDGHSSGASPFALMGDLAGHATFWLVSLLFFFSIAAEVGVWNWLATFLMGRGFSERSALNIVSLGFALGLLLGRMAVVWIPSPIRPEPVTLGAAVLMAAATSAMLWTRRAAATWASVFLAGLSMAPVFPNCIAITTTAFPNDATALGLGLIAGWLGMAVSSPAIAMLSGNGGRLGWGLLLLPAASVMLAATCWLLIRLAGA